MLTLQADGAESLWDELLPEEVRALPGDLARLDEVLCDPALLAPIAQRWERELAEAGRFAGRGRPSLAMESYVCRLGLAERVPDESTVRKLTRRLGAEVVHELTSAIDASPSRRSNGAQTGSVSPEAGSSC